MASQVSEGFILLNANSIKSLAPGELSLLKQELEKIQRETRAQTPAQDDAAASQDRNRKINRISSAIQVIANKLVSR